MFIKIYYDIYIEDQTVYSILIGQDIVVIIKSLNIANIDNLLNLLNRQFNRVDN
jgi:hypothetical protein